MAKIVILVNKAFFSVFEVSGQNKKPLQENLPYDENSFKKFLEEFSKKNKKLRILFSEDTSYTIEISSGSLENLKIGLRNSIKQQLEKRVPDKIISNYWEYTKIDEEKYLAFSPITQYINFFIKSFLQFGINIELVESEKIAILRNKDPLVAIAEKREEEILIEQGVPQNITEKFINPQKKSTEILIILLIIILTIVIVGGVLYSTGIFTS